jgi:hypothetical protein
MMGLLYVMGRVWWCEAGDAWPWSWDVWSRHNSQHLLDPYTLSHVEHGIGLYLLLTTLRGRYGTAFASAIVVAVVEATWEVAENTEWMIQRYREVTISLDYFGDSIWNSVSDYVSCLAGLLFAHHVPPKIAGGVFLALELISVLWIRDSLLLNILMLVYPVDAVRQWQMGG